MSDNQESCYHLSFPEPRPCLQETQRLPLHCNNSPEKSDSKVQAVLSLCARTDVILKKKLKLNGRNGRNRSMSIIKQFKYGTAQLSWFPWRRSAQRVVILLSGKSTETVSLQHLPSLIAYPVIDTLPACPSCSLYDRAGEGTAALTPTGEK